MIDLGGIIANWDKKFFLGFKGYQAKAKTPLSKKVDVPLLTVSQETEFRSEALASRLAQLSIIDALYVGVSVKLKDQTKSSLQKMREAIAVKRI